MEPDKTNARKLAVFGSRSLTDARVTALIGEYYNKLNPSVIVTTQEPAGVCHLAQNFAKRLSLGLELHFLNPKYGKGAFEHRSDDVINSSDAILLIHDGKSKGTANELDRVKKFNKEFYYEIIEPLKTNTRLDTEDIGMGRDEESGWNPLTGMREFRSAHEAWQIYGRFRFAVSQRTFLTYVGKEKSCAPGPDGKYHVGDIELFAQAQAWPPAPSFGRGFQKGGEGGSDKDSDKGARLATERIKKLELENKLTQMEVEKKAGELLPKREYEQRLAAAAAVVGIEAETFVYDSVREIIHQCEGKPEKEDSLREYLLEKVRRWLHAFAQAQSYIVELDDIQEIAENENSDSLAVVD
jgi:hypothetical protein